ncbi:MAG: hypothetical protein KAT71_05830 [Gammaproteobacteria bacterium]|nr:hypothetical protein [Gammaproteobacteria bacterium]
MEDVKKKFSDNSAIQEYVPDRLLYIDKDFLCLGSSDYKIQLAPAEVRYLDIILCHGVEERDESIQIILDRVRSILDSAAGIAANALDRTIAMCLTIS